MEFKLNTRGFIYSKKEMTQLKKLGFQFGDKFDDDMYPILIHNPQIEFNTLEEIMTFINQYDSILVNENFITIWDKDD